MKPRVPASKYKTFIDFVKFLKSKNALSYFNLIRNNVFNNAEADWIVHAFIWCETNDEIFWAKLNYMWQDILQREQNR